MPKLFTIPDKILEKGKKYRIKNDSQPGDDFFIDKKYKGNLGSIVPERKLSYAFLTLLIIIFLLFAKVFYLQIIKGKEFHSLAESNRIKTEVIASPRGILYDRRGQALVSNIPKFSLVVEKNFLETINQDELIIKVSSLTNLSHQEIKERIEKFKDSSDIFLVFDLDYQKAMIFRANQAKYAGLKLQLTSQRKYTDPLNLSHVLGYLGKINPYEWPELKKTNYQFTDLVGKAGLEKEYEKILRGQPGKIEYEVDVEAEIVKTLNQLETVPGQDIILTIDYELNKKVTEILLEHTKKLGKDKAAALALDPETGEILALVSLPLFNNNAFSEPQKFKDEVNNFLTDKNEPLFNRAIAGEYPSGSTIKPLIAAAGLEEGIITERTTILSTGGLKVAQWFFPDWKAEGHGLTSVTKALAESVNTFFYYLGGGYQDFKGLGLEKIIAYARQFGLDSVLGIDLPGEADGFLPSREWKREAKGEEWYIGDTYHLSIGQGDILVTPLQMASLTATIANGGRLYQPHLVKEIIKGSKDKPVVIKPKIINQKFIKKENIEIVKKGLRQAVTSGSAQALNDLPFSTAGKTGTAQVSADQEPHAWFTVFAPYDQPEIVLTVLVENGGEGSEVALPIAKEVLRWYFQNQK